jgi:hypothetical protein
MWTVMREMGHASLDMVQRVYGHLGEIRHRSPVVEFRVANHVDQLRDAVAALPVRMQKLDNERAARRRQKKRRRQGHIS